MSRLEMAKVIDNENGQTVCLPETVRLNAKEVVVKQLGAAVLLVPENDLWQTFSNGLNGFTDDVFESGREQGCDKMLLSMEAFKDLQLDSEVYSKLQEAEKEADMADQRCSQEDVLKAVRAAISGG